MKPTKTILITGGTSGIGRESSLLLARQGHRVFAASRKPSIDPMPGVTYVALDVRSAESIQICVQEVLAQTGQIDVLINNAGYVGPAGASEEVSMEDVRALFETNFFGVIGMTNAVLPGMRKRRQGLIINVSSAAGRMALPPFFSFYAASKHALEGYGKGLSNDLRPLGIKVIIVEPGYFATNIHQSFDPPANPLDDFASEREHATLVDQFSILHGRDPLLVARLINRLVNGTPRHLRYPIGFDVYFMLAMRNILPEMLFEGYQRWLLIGGKRIKSEDNAETVRRKLGWRRLVLESKLTDRLTTGALISVLLFFLVLVLFILKQTHCI